MDYVQVVANLGFPIACCVYLAVRLEGIISKNTTAIISLSEAVASCPTKKKRPAIGAANAVTTSKTA